MEFLTMIGRALLCLTTLHIYRVWAQGECTDFRGRVISHGLHYVPGPDTCTLCVCDNGIPKVCKAVLCSPPQDCRSFRVGHTCCEFICLDDVVKPADGAEANVRVAAGGAAGVVLLTVALVVYRVRKQKRRRPPHADDQRSLTSIGYISGSMGYMGGTCETALAAWKPPGNYLPRGEAPPPYDEAVAQCRPEPVRMGSETPYHRTYPATMEALTRPDEPVQCVGHAYVNMPRPVQQMANTQTCYNAPLLQPAHAPDPPPPHHPLAANVIGFPSAIRLTGSLGAISSRGLLSVAAREPDHERPHNVPGFYTNNANLHTSLHRTIPRISTAADTSILEACFSRGDRALHGEVRRSFHRADRDRDRERDRDRDVRHDTGRSMPRNLNLTDRERLQEPPLLDQSLVRLAGGRSRAHSEEQNVGASPPPPPADIPATAPAALPAPAPHPPHPHPAHPAPPHNTLPLTIDKPSCVCSYEQSSAPGAEEADDYRSECENCKSASSSRWVLEEGWEAEAGDGTQTLQRRAPPAAPAPPATATLPQPVTKQSRTVMGPPSNWENWFNTIPDSDTESEEE
ncbi:hypothetical protein ABMA27_005619 [Loxostege sticticalis]|uniref:Integral membrane protein DGCR2/IDD n=1 Tax=Loxostege sticticalis TaxID=481309 RepID=A0ABR3HK57_LOXSC